MNNYILSCILNLKVLVVYQSFILNTSIFLYIYTVYYVGKFRVFFKGDEILIDNQTSIPPTLIEGLKFLV